MLSLYWSGAKSDCIFLQQNISIMHIDLPESCLLMKCNYSPGCSDTSININCYYYRHGGWWTLAWPYPQHCHCTGLDQILSIDMFGEIFPFMYIHLPEKCFLRMKYPQCYLGTNTNINSYIKIDGNDHGSCLVQNAVIILVWIKFWQRFFGWWTILKVPWALV